MTLSRINIDKLEKCMAGESKLNNVSDDMVIGKINPIHNFNPKSPIKEMEEDQVQASEQKEKPNKLNSIKSTDESLKNDQS